MEFHFVRVNLFRIFIEHLKCNHHGLTQHVCPGAEVGKGAVYSGEFQVFQPHLTRVCFQSASPTPFPILSHLFLPPPEPYTFWDTSSHGQVPLHGLVHTLPHPGNVLTATLIKIFQGPAQMPLLPGSHLLPPCFAYIPLIDLYSFIIHCLRPD